MGQGSAAGAGDGWPHREDEQDDLFCGRLVGTSPANMCVSIMRGVDLLLVTMPKQVRQRT